MDDPESVFFLSILHSMHYSSDTTFPATKCAPRRISMTACCRLALQYICCVLSLLWHSVSFLMCTSSCHSSAPASWQWQFSQISCGTCSAVLTSKFELSIFVSYCWEIIVTYSRLVWNSTCSSAGIQTLNDESLCDIIEWYTSLGIIKNKLLFFLPEMYSPYSCNLNLY